MKTGAQRLRPVFLTTATTVLGLLPIASHLSIDFVNRAIVEGSEVSQFWVKLASSIVHGLTFAAILTLIVTPILLVLPHAMKGLFNKLRSNIKLPARSAKPSAELEAK
ncbi:MAG: efflux RND transporter permease subunit [Pseudomonadota bacterium]